MQVVPLIATPSQTLSATLAGQATVLNVYQKSTGLFMDVLANDALIIGGVICQDSNRIVRNAYLGFVGDFAFIDTQASADPAGPAAPYYTGLGARFQLLYLDVADLGTLGLDA